MEWRLRGGGGPRLVDADPSPGYALLRGQLRFDRLGVDVDVVLGVGYEQYGRHRAEVLVDCVTYVVLGSVGLDVGGESIPYVAGWGKDGALDAIRAYARGSSSKCTVAMSHEGRGSIL